MASPVHRIEALHRSREAVQPARRWWTERVVLLGVREAEAERLLEVVEAVELELLAVAEPEFPASEAAESLPQVAVAERDFRLRSWQVCLA